ncbi:MAG: hypothetical protein FJ102_23315 [Deltaproteobacteria bacterium]|nr:hypothetical protein [Deltaproteobacteria bacterium]
MQEQAPITLSGLRAQLWGRVREDPGELALAAQALLGRAPEADDWPELLDFAATEWVGPGGRVAHEDLDLPGWIDEVRTGLWTVDGWDGALALLRDCATDEEIAVQCPGAEPDLPRRTVLRARVVPWDGHLQFFGEPALFGQQGVIGRMQLVSAWRDSPEPATLSRQRELRRAFALQRDQHAAFVAHFGGDFVRAPGLGQALNAFLDDYLFRRPSPRFDGKTPAAAARAHIGRDPSRVELRLGDALSQSPTAAALFDATAGFLVFAHAPTRDDACRQVATSCGATARVSPSCLPCFEEEDTAEPAFRAP